ncbi:HindIII family type II restriction endonuclease [Helicobacter sp. 23-1048]
MFNEFLKEVLQTSNDKNLKNFKEQSQHIHTYIDKLQDKDIKIILKQIGTIPECIQASSSAEKLFSKSSDIVLARAFAMLGLKSKAITERADSADVVAQSVFHRYSLVADAKCFRLSRTAKNQKDFKVSTLSNWRGSEHEFAVLVSPYFQYPKEESQIYKLALDNNVCLLSWEHISILLENNVAETQNLSLESIWDSSKMFARESKVASAKECFIPKVNKIVAKKLGISNDDFTQKIKQYRAEIVQRGGDEIAYCNDKIESIKKLTREQAIGELIKETKLKEKISVIQSFISSLGAMDK